MGIKRYFSDKNFERVKKDFKFLSKIIKDTHGEYDLSIRDNYFNIYYKGYSIGKITPKEINAYAVLIHSDFYSETTAYNRFSCCSKKVAKKYCTIFLKPDQLYPFFQKKYLNEFASRVKDKRYGEIVFEQSIITDNLNRDEIIIIDRQIIYPQSKKKRLDLLALKQVNGNKFKIVLLEVKLGNNNELRGKVAEQLEGYVNHVKDHFDDYKECYEKHYKQKKELGLFEKPEYKEIEIVEPVEGMIVVGGYSGMAVDRIKILEKKYPHLDIKPFKHEL